MKTSKGIFSYTVAADTLAFCCEVSIEELKTRKHFGALSWIKKFENQYNSKGDKLLIEVLSRPNLFWYEMPSDNRADFVLAMNPDEHLLIQRLRVPTFVNQRLIRMSIKNELDIEFIHAILNTTIVISQIEGLGFGRGLGVLDINPTNLKKGLYLPKIELFSEAGKKRILSLFLEMTKTLSLPIEQELLRTDRMQLDDLVLKEMGLNVGVRKQIYDSLLKMYQIRKAVKR